jgi:hypothetical protein
MSKDAFWLFTGTAAYTNNTLKSAAIIKDPTASKDLLARTEGDTTVWSDIKTLASVKAFLTALGYTPSPTSQPLTVNSGIWRFVALTTNGIIHVAGSNDQLAGNISTDDLTDIKALLDADPDFHAFFTTTLH